MRALILHPSGEIIDTHDFAGDGPEALDVLLATVESDGIKVDFVNSRTAMVTAEERGGMDYNERASKLAQRDIRGIVVVMGMDGGREFIDVPGDMVLIAHAVLTTA